MSVEILTKLNNIHLNFKFALKLLMDQSPYIVLPVALIILILWSAYVARICDRELESNLHIYFWDSLWMMLITVATIGAPGLRGRR